MTLTRMVRDLDTPHPLAVIITMGLCGEGARTRSRGRGIMV